MKRTLFYFLVTVFSFNAFSQLGPGYMGKHVQVGYGVNTSPAFFGSNAQNESILGGYGSSETGSAAFNLIHEGFLDFSFSKRWSLVFSGRYYKTTYDNSTPFGFNYYNPTYRFSDERPRGYYNITGLTYSLYFKLFNKKYIAPWGRYIMFGPVINTVKTYYDPSVMYANGYANNNFTYSEPIVIRDFGPQEQSFTGFNILFGVGRSRVVANRITLDYGFNTHVISLLTTLFDYSGVGLGFDSYDISNYNYIESTRGKRIRGVNRFNVFLKVGVLLF